MLAKTYSASILGLTPVKIEIEVDAVAGVPNLIMIGLPGKSVEEARERITSALLNCGIKIRAKRTVVNLAPADLKKTGSAFELGIAVALLQLYEEITGDFSETIFLGELALDGKLRAVRGILALVMAAREMGFKRVFIPAANGLEVQVVSGIEIFLVSHLQEFIDWCRFGTDLEMVAPRLYRQLEKQEHEYLPLVDFKDIRGQKVAKRSLEIAAAGGHNLLMIGPPGSGKSLLAQALASILPDLSEEEMLEVTKIHSICGLNKGNLVMRRPFRAPHHTISSVGMIGGGPNLKPGEISLAHRGVLFLDEVLEFPRSILEALRQPLEDGMIRITRAVGQVEFPASLTLVAAANPCPCGYWGSKQKACQCAPGIREKYQQRLSGPIVDRLDQVLRVAEVEISDLSLKTDMKVEDSARVRKRVVKAREIQRARLSRSKYLTNGEILSADIRELCLIEAASEKLLQTVAEKRKFSARSYFKIMKMARTIADLDGLERVNKEAMAEAIQYRGYEL